MAAHELYDFWISRDYAVVVFRLMGKGTGCTILVSIGTIGIVSPASTTQHIEWAVAEEAVKIFWICLLMAGKIGARGICEKTGTVFHDQYAPFIV